MPDLRWQDMGDDVWYAFDASGAFVGLVRRIDIGHWRADLPWPWLVAHRSCLKYAKEALVDLLEGRSV